MKIHANMNKFFDIKKGKRKIFFSEKFFNVKIAPREKSISGAKIESKYLRQQRMKSVLEGGKLKNENSNSLITFHPSTHHHLTLKIKFYALLS
jgi:hypothetical protein